jgi:hypothetical protein
VSARRAVWSLVVIGAGAIVAGGLVSAASAGGPSEHSAWAVAYLVLVAGVAQVGLGLGQMWLAPRAPSGLAVLLELGCWNVGNAGVIAGVLLDVTGLVDAGGALLVIALALAVLGARDSRAEGRNRLLLNGFRALVVVLLVSIPVGLVLAR